MRAIFLTLTFSLFVSTLKAQSDLRPGYIVTNDADTIRGEINYRETDKSFRICEFKANGAAAIRTYQPGEISAFRFDNDKLFYSLNTAEVLNRQESLESGVFFMEVLVEGGLDLFRFDNTYLMRNRSGDFYHLYNTAGNVILTNDTDPYQLPEDRKYYHEKKEYLGLLKYATQDCKSLRLTGVKYNEKELTKVVQKYNECTGETLITYKDNKPWFSVTLNAELGIQYSKLTVEDEVKRYARYLEYEFEPNVTIAPGILFDLSSPRLSERTILEVGLQYTKNTYKSAYTEDNGYTITQSDFTINLDVLKIPIGIRYNFPGKTISPFIVAGAATSLHVSSDNLWIYDQQYSDGTSRHEENESILPIKNTQFGFYGVAGGLFKLSQSVDGYFRISFEVNNGLIAGNFYDNDIAKSKVTNLQLSAGIRL